MLLSNEHLKFYLQTKHFTKRLGSAVGVIVPDSLSDGERAVLEDIFANFTASHTEQEVMS